MKPEKNVSMDMTVLFSSKIIFSLAFQNVEH
jgi:hypothetical protein